MQQPTEPSANLSKTVRFTSGVLGISALGLLLVAHSLEPDVRGLGTHEQLGLNPCTIKQVFGIRCPSCGMTTSWSLISHGRVVAAIQANAGGVLLAALASLAGVWLVASAVLGRWATRPPSSGAVLATMLVVLAVVLLDWGRHFL